jgi:acylphosphatase
MVVASVWSRCERSRYLVAVTNELVRRRMRIDGRVQGVGFRWFARTTAQRLGLVGWTRNEADGSVLCEVQGTRAAVAEFERAVGRGPAHARVERVVAEDVPAVEAETAFVISR